MLFDAIDVRRDTMSPTELLPHCYLAYVYVYY